MSEYTPDIPSADKINSNDVVLLMSRLARELRRLSDEMDELEMKMVHAKEEYTSAYAKQYLDEAGPVEERKQRALWKTQDWRLAQEISEAMVKAHTRKMRTLERRIEVARSAAALVRMEADLMNVRR